MDFKTETLHGGAVSESIYLLIKHQYHLALNRYRQENIGTERIACHIDKNAINKEVFEKLKETYPTIFHFDKDEPISSSFNSYW